MDFSGCLDDQSFGPTVRGCRDDFDFTIKFEKIFFALIPSAIFVAVALARIVYLTRKPTIVTGVLLRAVKLATISLFVILQLSLLALSSTKSRRFAAFFIPADTLTLASGLCMLPLSYLEHARAPRPSILFNAFLFVSILLDVSQVRTLWLASGNADEITFSRIFTCGLAFKAVILVLESQSKARWIVRWDVKDHSPEETTGLYGLGAYFWLNRLFLAGYRKILQISDLFPLDQGMASETLHSGLAHHIDVSRFRGKNHALARAVAKALAFPLLLPVAPRIALGAFQFCQPFLIQTLLEHLQKPRDKASDNVGYGLIGATVLIYVGIAVSGALYWYFQERVLYMARGLLASAIYRKTTESRLTTSGDSAALTLMSTDIERIIAGCLSLHEFWANAVEVALASWLLSRQIGPAFVAPLIIVGVCVVCSAIFSRFTGPRQKTWMEKIQKRVGLTSNVIGQMKHLKISGLAEAVENAIQSMRVDELNAGAHFRTIVVFAVVVGFLPFFLSPVIAFAFASKTLNVTVIFTSMSFLTLLAAPLSILFQMIPSLLAAFTCMNRIQAFLEEESQVDYRKLLTASPFDGDASEEKSSPESVGQPKVKISGGNFGWEAGNMSLKNIDLDVPASQLTLVVGPVASGKSTLCKALLGEVPVAEGQVTVVASSSSRIGYCDQNPYLSNATIRENIVGFAPFLQARYDEVIEATMLGPDLALLPNGDSTNIGSNGITLSGGQKQRVSIARALYLDTDFYIFDDILSGLDADTEEQVFLRVFSPVGLIRQRNATALLCTHSVRHLPSADHIVALGAGGSIVEQGTFQELMANEKYVSTLGVEDTQKSSSRGSSTPPATKPSSDQLPKPKPTKPVLPSDVEEKARMTGDWAVYRHYFARIGTWAKVVFVVFGALWGGMANFGTVWLSFWSSDVASANPTHSNAFYNGLYALFQMITLFSLFETAWVCFTSMISISGAALHKEVLRTVINAPLKFFTTSDTGVVVNLFSQDMTLIDGQLPQALINLILSLFEVLGMAAVIATSSPWVAITYPVLMFVLFVLQKFYLRTSRQIRLLDLEAKSPLYSHYIDTIKGIATFRALGWVHEGIQRNYHLLDTSQRPTYLLAMIQRWLALTLQLVVAVIAVAVVAMATQLRSSTAFTGAGLIALMSFGETLAQIIRFYTLLETSIGAVSRLKAFGENVKPETKPGEDVIPPPEWPLKGAIEINGVSASYNDDDPEHLALDDLHLSIAPGEKVAICGRSGSGKSSLLLLLLRLLDPLPPKEPPVPNPQEPKNPTQTAHEEPSLTIDTLPLASLSRPHLRQSLLALPQDPVFLPPSTPLRTNLDPNHAATPADCRAALEAVSLWSTLAGTTPTTTTTNDAQPQPHPQTETDLEEILSRPFTPTSLSQGQRQLFSLARVLLRRRVRALARAAEFGSAPGPGPAPVPGDGGILLLDEVSSSVDRETDEAMQRVILREFAGYTIVMVSHRLEAVMGLDRVVIMDAGRVVETGPPRELAETEGSRFRELWMVGNNKG